MIAWILLTVGLVMVFTANVMQNYERENQVVRMPWYETTLVFNFIVGILVCLIGSGMLFAGWW